MQAVSIVQSGVLKLSRYYIFYFVDDTNNSKQEYF